MTFQRNGDVIRANESFAKNGKNRSGFRRGWNMNLLFGYFDPSAGSLVLQALVGGFGGIVVVGRYLWNQFLGNSQTQPVMSSSQEIPVYPPKRAKK
jgi:hypothetical protein